MHVYGVYMPVRQGAEKEVAPAWDAMDEDMARVRGEILIGGDLNAETRQYIEERRGTTDAQTLADEKLEEIMEAYTMTAFARGATYRAGSQIDNWIATQGAAAMMGGSTNLPGVCGDDHRIVIVKYVVGGEEGGGAARGGVRWSTILLPSDWCHACVFEAARSAYLRRHQVHRTS